MQKVIVYGIYRGILCETWVMGFYINIDNKSNNNRNKF